MSRVCFGPATYDSSCRTSIFLSISVWSSYFVYACLNLVLGGEVSWNDLVQNPAKWWDNRLDKVTHFLNCPCVLKSLQIYIALLDFVH